MAQPAGPAALVEDLDLERAEHGPNVPDDRVGGLILDEAAVHRDDGVAPRLIHAGDDLPPRIERKGGMHLVAVVIRFLHPQDRLDGREGAEQLLRPALLAPELLRIGHGLELAAAAFSIVRAGRRSLVGHGQHLTPQYNILRVDCKERLFRVY